MKIVSVNIERERHLHLVLPFIEREEPNVLCLQEVCENNLNLFANLGYTGEFLPETIHLIDGVPVPNGTALLARSPFLDFQSYYYHGSKEDVCDLNGNDVVGTQQKAVLVADINIDGTPYKIGTTHFTWTPDGKTPNNAQIEDMEKFLSWTTALGPHIMCGDFNIPRHYNPLYERLLEHYTDNIPPSYSGSLDPNLHKLGKIPELKHLLDIYMVDYMFTQTPYKALNVRLEFGLSDHAGIVATIKKEG